MLILRVSVRSRACRGVLHEVGDVDAEAAEDAGVLVGVDVVPLLPVGSLGPLVIAAVANELKDLLLINLHWIPVEGSWTAKHRGSDVEGGAVDLAVEVHPGLAAEQRTGEARAATAAAVSRPTVVSSPSPTGSR